MYHTIEDDNCSANCCTHDDHAMDHYPRLRGRRVQYFVCVCVLPQNCCLNSIITKSKQVAALKLGNLRQTVALYKTG